MNPKDINIKVTETLALAGNRVLETAIDRLVTAEIEKRSSALHDAIKLAETAQRELYKINKPDQVVYGLDNKPISEGYSKVRLEEIKKATEKLAKIEKAVEAATAEKPDYSKLYELKSVKPEKDESTGDQG